MNLLVATDSFKDALKATAVCEAIAKGLRMADANFNIIQIPLADGGEGTLEVFLHHAKARLQTLQVNDPLFRPTTASYALSEDRKTAFIEMASASGLEKLLFSERNPLYTSSFGTGELIKDAIDKGVEKILLAIGGSATNDGGIGMAAALGYYFLDEHGSELSPIGNHLARIAKIDGSRCPYRVALQTKQISVEVLCDVNNPLYGTLGAAYVYASQKGATEETVMILDDGLRHYARLVQQQFQMDISQISGAGAAGGLGAGAITFLNATLRSGIEVMMDYVKLEEKLSTCHLLITGEGKIDAQSLQGKLIKGLTSKAQHFKVPVIALCGDLQATPAQVQDLGLQAAFSILNAPMSLEDAFSKTAELLTEIAFHVGRLLISK